MACNEEGLGSPYTEPHEGQNGTYECHAPANMFNIGSKVLTTSSETTAHSTHRLE
jgi:hypothetical protein